MAKAKKKKISNQHDYILLDRSGSMVTQWSDAIGGVNAYVQGLAKNDTTKDIFVTVAIFDTAGPFDVIRKNVPASAWDDIKSTEASPRGGTPLYDAVGRLVNTVEIDAPEKAAIVIMTDGQENASQEHNQESAKKLLDKCRDKGWQVLFLGSNFDNAAQGARLGNMAAATMSYDSANTAQVFISTATMRGLYASGAVGSMAYSAEDRKKAGSPKA